MLGTRVRSYILLGFGSQIFDHNHGCSIENDAYMK